jgi:glucuronate isomerase
MKKFMDEHFLLQNKTAEELYHTYAKNLPLIDYHCHLSPKQIAEDYQFKNITDAWLAGDHYKWRAMRTNAVPEHFCTGDATDFEKFKNWAATVPYTVRNPLYHWTHLELQRYFGIDELLSPATAESIYQYCTEQLQSQAFTVKQILRKMNVSLVCTTDDPVDDLRYHIQIQKDGFEIPILPAFRPDKAMDTGNPGNFVNYIKQLETVSNLEVSDFSDYLKALKNRHDFFAENGCVISDHGLEEIYAENFTAIEIENIFDKLRVGKILNPLEQLKFKSAMLLHFAEWDHEKGWVQQFHLGALRNNNERMIKKLGADTGWDSIGDFSQARSLAKFLSRLDAENKLTKTILYNLNPADNALFASMAGNFNDGSVEGKIQYGAAWWFLDQKDGMVKQLNALSNMGLLSKFVGMLTDSRSFLSFPRHEYFRRILCNLFGKEIEQGELPNDKKWMGKIIQDICYKNARTYFGWEKNTPEII